MVENGEAEETPILTARQATAVAGYLIALTPRAFEELEHSYISGWQMSCEALEALGYATETARGALLNPAPVLPPVLPRLDDVACVVLSVAVQSGRLKLRHPQSELTDETGPSTTDSETAALLALLGLISAQGWTDTATVVLWRTAPEEVRPPVEEEFSAQVDQALNDIPDAIRARIHSIYTEHANQTVRDYLVDWVFFEAWRWGDGWLTDDSRGRPLGIFHDLLAQRVRDSVLSRPITAKSFHKSFYQRPASVKLP